MASPQDLVKLVRSESDRLKQYLSTLSPGQWSHPSACDRWEVRDVVAHLALGAETFAGFITRGVQGDSAPPPGLPGAGASDWASRMEFNARRTISFRESLGEQLLPTFGERYDQFCQLLAGLGPEDWDKPCYHAAGIMPVRSLVSLRIAELSIHEWDIRSGLEPSAHLSAKSLPVVTDVVLERIGFLVRPDSRPSTPVRYRFELVGTVPGKRDVVVDSRETRLEAAGRTRAKVTFRCDAETFALLMYGRVPLDDAIATTRVAAEGDSKLVSDFGRWLKGV